MENGQEHCDKEIEAHKDCMRKMGFKVWPDQLFRILLVSVYTSQD